MLDTIAQFHPLLVHLPIGIVVFVFIANLLPKEKRIAMASAVSMALIIAAASAVFASVSGYLLSLSGEYDETLVQKHKWLGFATAALCIAALLVTKYRRPLIWTTTLVMAIAGHYGGSLTHGEDYLFGPKENIIIDSIPKKKDSLQTKTLQDTAGKTSSVIMHHPYLNEIKPILQQKCYNCHSSVKKKGGLRLDTESFIAKGGKNGKILTPNDPENSTIYTHLLLPLEDEMHMPPKGKKQLSAHEIKLIHHWIATGAPFAPIAVANESINTPSQIQSPAEEKTSLVENPVSTKSEPIQEKALPLLDVSNLESIGIVTRQDTEGLSINFVNIKKVTPEMLNTLDEFSNNVTELKLGEHMLTDDLLEKLPSLSRLKKLNLSKSDLSDKGMIHIKKFPALQQLLVYETNISDNSMNVLSQLNQLKKVVVWNTKVTDKSIRMLMQKKPELQVEFGAVTLRQADSIKSK